MNHVRVLLASLLLTASFLSKANNENGNANNVENGASSSPCFITNKSGNDVKVEFWRIRGWLIEDSFVLPNNSMTDIVGLRSFEIKPEEYYVRFVYPDSEGRFRFPHYQNFLIQTFIGQNIVVFGHHREALMFPATEKMIEASKVVDHTVEMNGPFMVGPAQKEYFFTGLYAPLHRVCGKRNYNI